jgi:hypothetical protein
MIKKLTLKDLSREKKIKKTNWQEKFSEAPYKKSSRVQAWVVHCGWAYY